MREEPILSTLPSLRHVTRGERRGPPNVTDFLPGVTPASHVAAGPQIRRVDADLTQDLGSVLTEERRVRGRWRGAARRRRLRWRAAGARAVSVRAGRLVITPIELDSAGVRELRGRLPQAVYESGRSQISLRVAEIATERFPEILAAADAVLAATGTRE